MGGERDRDAPAGPDRRAAADPRPVRQRARGARRAGRPGRHLRARRRDLPRPALPRARRADGSRSTPGRPMRWPWRSAPGPGSSRPTTVLDQAGLGADPTSTARGRRGRGPSGRPRRSRRSTGERASSTRGSTSSATSSTRSTADPERRGPRQLEAPPARGSAREAIRTGSARRGAAPVGGSTHRRSRSGQKSRTARKTTCGLAPVARAGRARVVGHADLDDRAARRRAA